ncbi:glycosyltransferase family 9 protein [uncultured Shewanella sp.]|uniref:glycosyltransferase family 9 protein n=1 Tax=uncultured Shewanella sp. TaxID=173975 RepID=UPI002630370A|nr:glycosyltransferase family 9 protein [uncultured Shewanella sp.]
MNTKEVISSLFTRKRKNLSNINELNKSPNVIINYNLPIGDYLSLSPVIDAILYKWHSANIYIICSNNTLCLVKSDPRVKPLCFPDKKRAWQYPSYCKKVASNVGDIDLLIEPCKLNRSFRSLIGYCLQPHLTIGLYWDKYKSIAQPIHLNPELRLTQLSKPKMYCKMLQDYGFDVISNSYKVYENNESRRTVERYLNENNIQSYIIINPFASTIKRTLNLSQVKNIIVKLNKTNKSIILLIPPYIENSQVWKNLDNNIICPPINNIMDSVSYVKNSTLVISVDTSIVHIASSFNKPTIALYREQDLAKSCWLPTADQHETFSLTVEPELILETVNQLYNTKTYQS